MQDSFLVEIFSETDFTFISKAITKEQKYEFDYLSLVTNSLSVPGYVNVSKKNYIQIKTRIKTIQGVVTGVEHTEKDTKIKFKDLRHLLDVDVYKERSELATMTAEEFIGEMVGDCFVNNVDNLQNIFGLQVSCISETSGAKLNLTDNIHNIYDLSVKAFKKYGIVVAITFDVMEKSIQCVIGVPTSLEERHIEADLQNVMDVDIAIKDYDEAANKVIIIGEYPEDSENYGQTQERVYYLDAVTGDVSMDPENRITPVVFKYKVITVDTETFEDDAREEAVDILYREKHDNSIKITFQREDSLQSLDKFQVGQVCKVIKDRNIYESVFTGWMWNKTIRLQLGVMRTEYTKNIRGLR